MAAISVTFTPKVASDWDPQKPLTTTKLNQLYNNTTHLREWMGASYVGGAQQDHNHDGNNSALLEVGANMLRNGSFESVSNGWTLTNYTGGSTAVQATGAMHGVSCLAITSTVLANGGGYATSNEFMPVAPGRTYSAHALFDSSVAGVSSKIEILWYDSAQSLISTSTVQVTNTTTTATLRGESFTAPTNAAYAKVRVTGGVPTVGSAYGTVYVDGCIFGQTIDGNLIKFTRITATNASWAPQLETRRIVVRCVGSGGGGGSGAFVTDCGSDGMDGNEVWGYTGTIAATYVATIGASAAAGATGNTTSFGSVASAAGGAAGKSSMIVGTGTANSAGANGAANSGQGGGAGMGGAGGASGSGVIDVWEYA